MLHDPPELARLVVCCAPGASVKLCLRHWCALLLSALLDPESLPPESLLKDCQNILVRHGLRESFWGAQSWPNPA